MYAWTFHKRTAAAEKTLMIKKILPPFFYLAVFFILSPHLVSHFSSHFFTDTGDGLRNIWNIWWVNKAVCGLGTHPWSTDFLQYPYGTSLVGYTLNPFNGFAGIVLLKFLTLVQTHNAIVVFSFVMCGMTAFWLCRYLCGSYVGSLIGGAVFNFYNYHFMHADGHLQLVSLEWLPLFMLLWVRFCRSPDIGKGVTASLALFLVILCDYYYFFYCVIAGFLFFLWMAHEKKDFFFLFRKETIRGLCGFLVTTLLSTGPLAAALVFVNLQDPVSGSHASTDYSMDLLSPFVWGPHWRFSDWVEPLWRPLCVTQNANESSVYLGLSVIALIIYAWKKRALHTIPYFRFWCLLGAFFFVMSLGPNLLIGGREVDIGLRFHFMGKEVNPILLPYAVLWMVFPPIRMSGVPLRMMVMVQLVAAIFVAAGFCALLKMRSPWKYAAATVFLAALTFEYLPAPIPLTKPECPAYIEALKNFPDGAVLDLSSSSTWALYYQTVHQKKMGFGHICRTTASVGRQVQAVSDLILDGKWEQLVRDYHFTYIVKSSRVSSDGIGNLPLGTHLPEIAAGELVFNADGVSIYRF
jgi:hypothetical protein